MSPLNPTFLRHVNTNGTIDSVCRTCFVTVASASKELELEEPERTHVCDPQVVKHWKEKAEGKQTADSIHNNARSLRYVVEN